MQAFSYQRGDIVWINLGSKKSGGHEQKETRPAIIVQNDVSNRFLLTTIVVPLTDAAHLAKLGPNHVLIPKGMGSLKKDSVALCNQITTVDIQRRIFGRIGALDQEKLAEVDTALKVSLGLE